MQTFKRKLLIGMVVIFPIAIVVWILAFIASLLQEFWNNIILNHVAVVLFIWEMVPEMQFLYAFILTMGTLFLVGCLCDFPLLRRTKFWHKLERIPVLGGFLHFGDRSQSFKKMGPPCLVEYPQKGQYSYGLIMGREKIGDTPVYAVWVLPETFGKAIFSVPHLVRFLGNKTSEVFRHLATMLFQAPKGGIVVLTPDQVKNLHLETPDAPESERPVFTNPLC